MRLHGNNTEGFFFHNLYFLECSNHGDERDTILYVKNHLSDPIFPPGGFSRGAAVRTFDNSLYYRSPYCMTYFLIVGHKCMA